MNPETTTAPETSAAPTQPNPGNATVSVAPSGVSPDDSAATAAKFDRLVRDKIAAGLPRSDAEFVARRQIAWDKQLGVD